MFTRSSSAPKKRMNGRLLKKQTGLGLGASG
jgi:hypothetical protein